MQQTLISQEDSGFLYNEKCKQWEYRMTSYARWCNVEGDLRYHHSRVHAGKLS
jgi:hypothetical protein